MDRIREIGVIFLRITGIMAIFALLVGSLFWLRPDGKVQMADIIFVGTAEDADCSILLNRDQCIVIDTGEEQDAEQILEILRAQGVTKIDCMMLTHPDRDHIGGASKILDEMKVELVIAPYYAREDERYDDLLGKISSMGIHFLTPSRNREFYYGDWKLRVFPPDDLMYEKDNDYSLITLAEHGDIRMLFMGDAEKKRILETEVYRFSDVDLYKIPHHGRNSKTGARLIEELQPEFAIVTAKKAEEEIEETLKRTGTQVSYTVPQNHVVFHSDGTILTREPDRPGTGEGTAGGL